MSSNETQRKVDLLRWKQKARFYFKKTISKEQRVTCHVHPEVPVRKETSQ